MRDEHLSVSINRAERSNPFPWETFTPNFITSGTRTFFTSILVVLATGQVQKQRIRVETITVQPGSVLLIFTDGLKSRTNLKGQLDILRRSAITIAQHLLENDSRPDDDALVLVARFR